MSDAIIKATLRFNLSDFDDDPNAAEELDEFDFGVCVVALEPLGGNLYRVANPTSLTPFGPFGGGLTLGQVIEARPASGPYRAGLVMRDPDAVTEATLQYVSTHSRPPVWNWGGVVERRTLNDVRVARLLRQLQGLGAEWEWAVGSLSVQGPGEQPSAEIQPLLDKLADEVTRIRTDRRVTFKGDTADASFR